MTTKLIGNDPWDLGDLAIPDWDEFMFVQDMPISLPGGGVVLPNNLKFAAPFVERVREYLSASKPAGWLDERYFYLCAKHTLVGKDSQQTRPGWHTDGFGTDDLSFLWADCLATTFLYQAMRVNVDSDIGSMVLMKTEAKDANARQGYDQTIYGMDDTVIHAPTINTTGEPRARRFLKLSVSRYPYDLAGNARNPLLQTPWQPNRKRVAHRNNPENRT